MIRQSHRLYTGNSFHRGENLPLHNRYTIAADVTRHVQIGAHQDGVLRVEAEIAVQRAHQTTHGHQGRGDQHRTYGYLQDEQHIPGRKPLPELGRGSCLDDLVWVGAQNLAHRHGSKQASAQKRQQQRDSYTLASGVTGVCTGKLPNGCQTLNQCNNATLAHTPAAPPIIEITTASVNKSTQNAVPARSERQAQSHFARSIGSARREQAAKIGARRQKYQCCQEHQSGNELLDGAGELIAE